MSSTRPSSLKVARPAPRRAAGGGNDVGHGGSPYLAWAPWHELAAPDLLAATAELVAIPSVSHDEAAAHRPPRGAPAAARRTSTVERVGANLVARTQLGRSHAGDPGRPHRHRAGERQRRAPHRGRRAVGPRRADMKGGLAVMLALAETVAEPAVDVTYVFYAGEEVAAEHNGLAHLVRDRPDLLAGDVAILGEPTGGELEAGCQGTLRDRGHACAGSGPTPPGRGWAATPSTASATLLRAGRRLRGAPAGDPGLRVPRGAAGGGGVAAAWPATSCPTSPPSPSTTASPPTAPRPRPPTRCGRCSRPCSRTATRSRSSTRAGRRARARQPDPAGAHRSAPARGHGQARLDRRRPLRRARRARLQPRPRRRHPRPHRRRARRPRVARPRLRGPARRPHHAACG